MSPSALETETRRIGGEILDRLKDRSYPLFDRQWWAGKVLERCAQDEAFKVALFRFVDVLPNLKEPRQVVRLFREYFEGSEAQFPSTVAWGLKWGLQALGPASPLAAPAARIIRDQIAQMARQFIAGRDLDEALPRLRALWDQGLGFSLSFLGEVAVNERESLHYADVYGRLLDDLSAAVSGWPAAALPERDRWGAIPRANLSVKVSSLYSKMDPMDWEGSLGILAGRLRPLLLRAQAQGVHVHLDMEHYELKDLILALFFRVLEDEALSGYQDAGLVVQAYLRDSEEDLNRVLAAAERLGRRFTVRLVRGAYWDYERVIHQQRGWPVPVYLDKGSTDESYERLAGRLISRRELVRPAFGTHNVRSLAYVMALARQEGLAPEDLEFQVLYGMGGPIQAVLREMGCRVRVYTPVGELIPGMAYLVRRLLENTSNESFIRRRFMEGVSPERVLAPPEPQPPPPAATVPEGFRNEPPTDFSREESRIEMKAALERVRRQLGRTYPLRIGKKEVGGAPRVSSVNPARPREVVGEVCQAGLEEAQGALAAAQAAFPAWRSAPAGDRAEVLLQAARILRKERYDLAAWEVYEEGKTWREADADLAESIDFLVYYAGEMRRLAEPRRLGGTYPGEENLYLYEPRGLGVVISPWNFPLAIPTGMVSAALVTGNCVLFKPADLSAVMGHHLVRVLYEAGLPDGVLSYLPAPGHTVGEYLVKHPDVAFIAFTGSKEVGLRIVELAGRTPPGQRQVKRVVAEMGGKNAIIVDDTADLDLAVLGVVASALGYQGQKCSACSRVIVLEAVYEDFVERMVQAVKDLRIGPPEDPGCHLGPVIDAGAREKIRAYIERGGKEGRGLLVREAPEDGYFVGPAVFADLGPGHSLAQEEIFGPVLVVLRVRDFEEALGIANGVDFALTGGVYSRSPAHIRRASEGFQVGNLYINRGITGALVGRQPFGGFRLSGVGSKAGGPDYLSQFMVPRAVTENTLRRGFAPSGGEEAR